MFEIREKSGETLETLIHGESVFHDALKDGKKKYHVTNQNGIDYDIVYTKNFDYVLPMMPEAYRFIEVYWDFLTYDENRNGYIVLDQFDGREAVVFDEVNEYTVVIGKVLLRERKDLDLYYRDEKILWFLPAADKLHVGGELPKDTEKVLYVTKPLGHSYQSTVGNKIGVLAVFQSMFYLQAITDKDLSKVKYIRVQFDSGLTGIGAIMSTAARFESIFKSAGWKAYVEGEYLGKYSREMLSKYLDIPPKPADANDENTLFLDQITISRLTITYSGIHANRVPDIAWFKQSFLDEMEEYAQSVVGGKKMLGVYIRGTDYIASNIPGANKQASVKEMVPLIREWLVANDYEKIFLATEDEGILKQMREEFGNLIRIVSQERFNLDEFKTAKLIAELENEKYDPAEKEEHIEDMSVNYFYAMYTLSKCDSLIASGMSNGVDLIRCFNGGNFQNDYQFSVGVKQ